MSRSPHQAEGASLFVEFPPRPPFFASAECAASAVTSPLRQGPLLVMQHVMTPGDLSLVGRPGVTSQHAHGCWAYAFSMETMTELQAARAELTQAGFRLLNSVVEPAVKAGLGNPFAVGAGAIVLEVTGRKSGKKRRVPLLASRVCDKLVVSTVRGDSQWLKNAEADAAVTVWLNGKARAATASVNRGPLNVVLLSLDHEQ